MPVRTSNDESRSESARIVEADGLTRRFGDKVAVDDLSLTVDRGELFALLGHNGAGKTTTIRMVNGVLAPTSGSARLFGLSPFEHGPELRARVGVLTENTGLEERLTARQNLAYYAELYGYPRERVLARIDALLGQFGLAEAADVRVGGFSKGMKQRLALARALQHEPELLFLDEPTSGLDPMATRNVIETMQRQSRQEGRTVVICTHDLALAQRICDRVAVLRHGRVVALGTPSELAGHLAPHGKLVLGVAAGQRETAERVLREAFPEAEAQEADGAPGELSVTRLAAGSTPALVAHLVEAGVDVLRVEPVEPTLADVYFALHGRGDEELDGPLNEGAGRAAEAREVVP